MKIQEMTNGKDLTLVLEGNFDEMTSPMIEKRLEEVLEDDIESVTFNMRHVRYISSAGIRVLIIAHKRAMKNGKKVRIGEMSDKVREVIKIVGILPLFSM